MAKGRLGTPKLYEFFKGTARRTGEQVGRFPIITVTENRPDCEAARGFPSRPRHTRKRPGFEGTREIRCRRLHTLDVLDSIYEL